MSEVVESGGVTGAGVPAGASIESCALKVNVTFRPPSGTLASSMRPSCNSTIFRVTLRPSPVPSPVGFVVKNGSNTLLSNSGGMPGPLSRISRTTTRSPARKGLAVRVPKLRRSASPSSRVLVVIVRRPPFFIACKAFVMRLTMTCSIRVLSANNGGSSEA